MIHRRCADRRRLAVAGALAALLLFVLHTQASSDGARDTGTLPTPDTLAMKSEGARVYSNANCVSCHGGLGNGEGPLARNMPNKPRDFTDHSWMANHADGTLFTSVQRGVPGTSMPAFAGRLSDREIWAVVAYVRGFSDPPTIQDRGDVPARTDRAASAGRSLFRKKCSGCHGVAGRGNGASAEFFERAPRDLTNRDWMASRSNEQLQGVVRYGVAGTPMPGFAGELRDEEIAALITYLRILSSTTRAPNADNGPGSILYIRNCMACHGADGDGDGPGANQLSPRPRDFRSPFWMAAQTDDKLADAIRNGRPGTNMPPFGAKLSPAEIAAVVQYLRGFATAIPGASASTAPPPDATEIIESRDPPPTTPPPPSTKGAL